MVAKSATKKTNTEMVNSELLNKAVNALLKHHKESESNSALLGNDLPVQVQFTLARVPERTSARPIRIEIPHPLHKVLQTKDDADTNQDGLEDVEVCLIVKDESKESITELIELFPSHTSCVKKVLTLTSLRKKYSTHKARRELLKRYDLFLADDRILPMLGKALGKNFFQEKKHPIPLKVTRKEALPFAIQKSLKSSYMFINPGTCISIKAGNTAMPAEYLVANVEAIVNNAVGHIPRKWANVSAVNVKTAESIALPVYNKTREELEVIATLANVDVTKSAEEKKRARAENEEEAELAAKESAKVKKQKKELAAKSPLVKALKMTKKKRKEDDEAVKVKATPSKKKKKRSNSGDDHDDTSINADADAVKSKTPKSSKKKLKSKESAAVVEPETPKSSKKKKISDDGSSSSKKKKISEDGSSSKEFVSSKKFKGSKKGYVFKKGSKGVGYYVDVKPVVDKMALAALQRSSPASKGRRQSAGRKGKAKGRRSY